MKKLATLLAVALAVFAVISPAVASGSNAAGGMGNRFDLEASRLAAPPIVMVETGGRMELATVARISRDVTALTLPSGRVLLHVEPVAFQDVPPAGQPWQGALFYDVRAKESAVIVLHPLTSFRDFIVRGLNLDLDGFAGLTTTTKAAVGGVSFDYPFRLSSDGKFTGKVGVGFTGQLGGSIGVGLLASATVKF